MSEIIDNLMNSAAEARDAIRELNLVVREKVERVEYLESQLAAAQAENVELKKRKRWEERKEVLDVKADLQNKCIELGEALGNLDRVRAENERLKQRVEQFRKRNIELERWYGAVELDEHNAEIRADERKKTIEEIADMAYNRGLSTFADEFRKILTT